MVVFVVDAGETDGDGVVLIVGAGEACDGGMGEIMVGEGTG